jgi:hypothetical protein
MAPASATTSISVGRSAAKAIISRKNIDVGFLHERAKGSSSHWSSAVARLRLSLATRSYRRIAGDHRMPLVRDRAIEGALRERHKTKNYTTTWGTTLRCSGLSVNSRILQLSLESGIKFCSCHLNLV